MLNKSALTRIQAIIAILLVLFASFAYAYVYFAFRPAPPPATASFQLANLSINPQSVVVNQQIVISVELTNVGLKTGNYSTDLYINGSIAQTQTAQVNSGETTVQYFTVMEAEAGTYAVKIGDLTTQFNVESPIPIPTNTPSPSGTPAPNLNIPDSLKLSGLLVSPFEVWANDSVSVSFNVTNTGDASINFSIPVIVNGAVILSDMLQFPAKATVPVVANVTGSAEGTYAVTVGTLATSFNVVPTGEHTLIIRTFAGIPFTINGQAATTPYEALLDVGTYTIVMPVQYNIIQDHPGWVRHYTFQSWDDGSRITTRVINLQSYTMLVAGFAYTYSCPSLYVWNGTSYISNGDVSSDGGWLGFVDHYGNNGSTVFAYSDPWDYVKLDSQTQSRNGYFDLVMAEQADEIFYTDAVKLLAVDHPANVDVFSTAKTYIYKLDGLGTIYSVSKNLSLPVSAVDGNGKNVLPQISKADGITTDGNLWKWDTLQLNLGNLTGAKEIKLVVNGVSVWQAGSGSSWNSQYANQPGVTPQPPPYMEVKDANGNWVRVPDSRQFPMLTATPTTIVLNLTGLFPTNDFSLRINTFQDIRFDYIGVDTSQQENLSIREIAPNYAYMSQAFSEPSNSTGNFTRYGDVLPLLLSQDDKMVIGRIGDQIALRFPDNLGPVPEGMIREYFFVGAVWFKARWLPGLAYAVDPLPFKSMTGYPYPASESYPLDAEHLQYLKEYNTRTIAKPK